MRSLFGLAVLLAVSSSGRAADRPNFVFCFADDQRFDAMSCVQEEHGAKGRFPWFKTPHMDRLAREGVRFRNAFVVNSLCSPSRACYLTGQYSHVNGIVNNTTPFPASAVTHASLLRAAGYSTGYVGKWHMGQQPARPGFDFFASFTGQGRYVNPNFLVNGKARQVDGWADDISTDFAISFLKDQRDKSKPFLLCVGFKAPHGPFDPPERRKESFAGEKARVVPNLGVPPGFNTHLEPKAVRPTEPTVNVNLNYFRCIAAVDDNLGRILKTLDDEKLSDSTVVIYASDNGFYLGEHTLADKRSGYDESLRIPFLVRDPRSGVKGITRDEMVLNIDLAPTLLDYAGLPVPREMHGKSWKSLIARPESGADPARHRAGFFYEYFRENGGKADGPNRNPGGYNTPTMTGYRTTTHKLLKYEGHDEWTELFDLVNDPYELKNRFKDPAMAAIRTAMERDYAALRTNLQYTIPPSIPKEPAIP